jgi:predicted AAA+ superfamily ATPase
LKNLYNSFASARIIFSGSLTLALHTGKADLSGRVVFYSLPGLSFREYLYTYLDSLERAGLIIGLLPAETGYRLVRKPSKITMENTNLLRAVAGDLGMSAQVGAVRETFFAHQVKSADQHITMPNIRYSIHASTGSARTEYQGVTPFTLSLSKGENDFYESVFTDSRRRKIKRDH